MCIRDRNMEGEVVGINSAKLASTEVEGMGYAIAISDVTDILQNLIPGTLPSRIMASCRCFRTFASGFVS